VSPPPYDTWDFALGHDAAHLAENLALLGAAVGFDPPRLYQAKQVHGARAIRAEGDARAMREGEEADAIVASIAGHAALVRVADCVPVLVADRRVGRVAAIHAGWPGIVCRAIPAALRALGGGDLLAAIGPSIGPCCFEVDREVADRIEGACGGASLRAPEHAPGKTYVDLRRAARLQLVEMGVADADIEDVPGCSRCDATLFYSWRRDGDRSGRQVGVIVAR
jgi:YfiH family protein